MKKSIIVIAALLIMAVCGSAHAGFISMLSEDGQVWKLNTTSGVATATVKYPDPGGSNEEMYSPNALGVSGSNHFYTTFNVNGNDTLYRNGTALTKLNPGEPYNIANGDAVGSNFYFVDRNNGTFWTIGNILAEPGAQSVASAQIPNFGGATMGDLAVKDNLAYLSTGGNLVIFDITNPGAGFSKSVTQERFVGLGFDGADLYGVLRVGANNFDLYSINTTTLAASKVADISGIPTTGGAQGNYEITDASRDATTGAPVPVPAAVWLLGSGLVGLVGLRRKFFA